MKKVVIAMLFTTEVLSRANELPKVQPSCSISKSAISIAAHLKGKEGKYSRVVTTSCLKDEKECQVIVLFADKPIGPNSIRPIKYGWSDVAIANNNLEVSLQYGWKLTADGNAKAVSLKGNDLYTGSCK